MESSVVIAAIFGAGLSLSALHGTAAAQSAINVKDAPYEAKGDCKTDDTAAIQAAVKAAEAARFITNFNPVVNAAVYLPPGCYEVSGLDIARPLKFYGDGPGLVTLSLMAGSNRSVLRVLPEPADEATSEPGWRQHMQPTLSGFSINGYGTAQSATSHGIEVADAPYSSAKLYGSGTNIDSVKIFGTRNDGLYIGKNRNFGFVRDIVVQYANGNGIELNATYDWIFSTISVGASGLDGLHAYFSSDNTIQGCAIYNNAGNGVTLSTTGGFFQFSNCTIGANGRSGIWYSPGSANQAASSILQVANTQLTDDSTSANGAYSHIYARDFSAIQLSNVWVYYQGGNNAAHIVDSDTSGFVSTSGLAFSTIAGSSVGDAPYVASAFSQPGQIIGNTNAAEPYEDATVPSM